MLVEAKAWQCEFEDCGHKWLAKSDVPPALCGRCRRRGWHQTKTTVELIREKGVDLDERIRAIVMDVLHHAEASTDAALDQPQSQSDRIATALAAAAPHLRTPATITTASAMMEPQERTIETDDWSQ